MSYVLGSGEYDKNNFADIDKNNFADIEMILGRRICTYPFKDIPGEGIYWAFLFN